MDEAKQRLALGWLTKAGDDLRVARLLIAEENHLYGSGAYHCQQTAEKALKAWLTCRDIVFPRTHDLEALLHLCREGHPGFSRFSEHAQVLTPLATEYRYPGDALEPAPGQARQALTFAAEIFAYCDILVHEALADA